MQLGEGVGVTLVVPTGTASVPVATLPPRAGLPRTGLDLLPLVLLAVLLLAAGAALVLAARARPALPHLTPREAS